MPFYNPAGAGLTASHKAALVSHYSPILQLTADDFTHTSREYSFQTVRRWALLGVFSAFVCMIGVGGPSTLASDELVPRTRMAGPTWR